jgi:hypothetical protein
VLNPVESDGDEHYGSRNQNLCALGAKPCWSASLMWCTRCSADLAPSRDLIPVFHILFRMHGYGPKLKSAASTFSVADAVRFLICFIHTVCTLIRV